MQPAAENAAKKAKWAPPRRLTPGEGFFVEEQSGPRKTGSRKLSCLAQKRHLQYMLSVIRNANWTHLDPTLSAKASSGRVRSPVTVSAKVLAAQSAELVRYGPG